MYIHVGLLQSLGYEETIQVAPQAEIEGHKETPARQHRQDPVEGAQESDLTPFP